MRVKAYVAAMAAVTIMVQPAVAADLIEDRQAMSRTTMFVGASVRMDLDQRRARPTARLQAGMTPAWRPGFTPMRTGGVEIGVAAGKPRLTLAGQDAQALRQRMGIGTTGTVLLVGAGVLALLVVVAVASAPADLLDTCDDGPECL